MSSDSLKPGQPLARMETDRTAVLPSVSRNLPPARGTKPVAGEERTVEAAAMVDATSVQVQAMRAPRSVRAPGAAPPAQPSAPRAAPAPRQRPVEEKKPELKAEYCCAVDRYRLMFARALTDRGFASMDYDYRLDRAVDRINEVGGYGILVIHGNLPGEVVDDSLIEMIRLRTSTPVLLVGFPSNVIDPHLHQAVEVLPPPVTVAAVADAAERMRPTPQSSLSRRLLELPGFSRHGRDAVAYLVDHATPVPLYPQQALYEMDEVADALYFVLAGGVMLTVDEREVDGVGVGSVIGEGCILEEGHRRPTAAVAREATVLLRITPEMVAGGPASFRALVFELIARTLAPRVRAPR